MSRGSVGWTDRGQGISLLVVVLLAFSALLIQCCAGCPLGIVEGMLVQATVLDRGDLITHPLALALTNVIALGTVLLLGGWLARLPFRELVPLRGFPPLLVVALLPAVFGTCVALMELGTVVETVLPMPDMLRDFFEQAFGGERSVLGSFFLGVVVAPLMEELFFRGLLLRGLLRRWPAVPAVVASALLFALFHANPWQFLAPLILGLFYGWLTVRSGSLWPAILAHALNNAIAQATMLLLDTTPESGATAASGPQLGPLWLDLLALACLIVGLAGCALVLRRRTPPVPEGPRNQDTDGGP